MTAAEFFGESANTHAREDVYNHRFLYDLKVAAANRGYHLLSYSANVDHDGCDIVLDDRDSVERIQLKTKLLQSTTTRWNNIHKFLLRPSYRNWEKFGYEFDATHGVQGCVVLITIDSESPNAPVSYAFTNSIIIALIAAGLFGKSKGTVSAAGRILQSLSSGSSRECVAVTAEMFVEARNPDNLLALLNLHSQSMTNWRQMCLRYISQTYGGATSDPNLPIDQLADTCLNMIADASGFPRNS
ncbi:hypothetical protein [Rhodopirellula europaea]|uniref:hypothetical protein n=1 Tax=Rhodopirellula europaea TaxID=1263866 RepID=UPI003D2DA943|tara:strand:+ start:11232 stop:11960 length:729 start_codon:yes stop_codon:yes gene_type:complete